MFNSTLDWPTLNFGPINLWSFPAAWKRQELASPVQVVKPSSVSQQVNPVVRQILANR